MPYFKTAAGDVFAYDTQEERDEFGPADLVPMTEAEVEAHLNPPLAPPSSEDVNAERDDRINAGFEFGGARFQSRAEDRENINGKALLAFMAISEGAKSGDLRWADPDRDFVWIAEDNSLVPMDAPTVVAFGKAAAASKEAHIFAGLVLKQMNPIPADYADDKWWP